MDTNHTYRLTDFLAELTEIPSSDVLVHADSQHTFDIQVSEETVFETAKFVVEIDPNIQKIIQQATENKRISDTQTTCISIGTTTWEYKNKIVKSPLILIPCTFKINKIDRKIAFEIDNELAFLNPFLVHTWKQLFDIQLDWNAELNWLENKINIEHQIAQFNLFQFENELYVGNFHHHRFQLVKELENLIQSDETSPLVSQLLGNDIENSLEKIELSNKLLVAADPDQLAVFDAIQQQNVVIQGPPGTGKSHVLTNIIGKSLLAKQHVLLVSEKKTALDVLLKKLSQHDLDSFAYLAHNQSKSSEFVRHLKKSWAKLELDEPVRIIPFQRSEALKSQLQHRLDRLKKTDLIGGVSLSAFNRLKQQNPFENAPFVLVTCSVSAWLEIRETLREIFPTAEQRSALSLVKKGYISSLEMAEKQLQEAQRMIQEIGVSCDFETFEELQLRIKQSARAQLLENEFHQKYAILFSDEKKAKKFEKLRIKWIENQLQLEVLSREKNRWIQEPSAQLIQAWKLELEKRSTWFQRRKFTKSIQKFVREPIQNWNEIIQNWEKFLIVEKEQLDLRKQCLQLGIENPETQLEGIAYLIKQLSQFEKTEFSVLLKIAPETRKNWILYESKMKTIYQIVKQYVQINSKKNLGNQLEEILRSSLYFLKSSLFFQRIDEPTMQLIARSETIEEVERIVLKSNWVRFESNFPELAQWKASDWNRKLDEINQEQQSDFHATAQEIKSIASEQFNRYHALLRTPTAQLKEEEKSLKKILKNGKAMLVREFSKQKKHKSIRELMDSDAAIWIRVLCPVWLTTPVQLATLFPMKSNLFDWVLLDEASQIPLANVLGALHRSTRLVVAGDSQQMEPSSFFAASKTSPSVLHQASYYFQTCFLKHHYRSEHPALIQFSNTHFYQSSLHVFPHANPEKKPIEWHFCPTGRFIDNQNQIEAKALVNTLKAQLETLKSHQTIGIVAFSKQQIQCIWNEMDNALKQEFELCMDENRGFIRSLDQVQGDECDVLLISLGYGKNENEAFHMRFGPLNLSTGAKRLNVLLTRAKSKIHFFSSVTGSDFAISTNESINLLRLFFQQLEQQPTAFEQKFPFGLLPHVSQNKLVFSEIELHVDSIETLLTNHTVLQKRGWEIEYW